MSRVGPPLTSGIYAGRLNLAGRKRYLRVVATVTGNTKTAEVAALVSLHRPGNCRYPRSTTFPST